MRQFAWLPAFALLAAAIGVRDAGAAIAVPFVPNAGQYDASVAFRAPTFTGDFYVLRGGELLLVLPAPDAGGRPWLLRERLVGGRALPRAGQQSATRVTHLQGADPGRWHHDLPTHDDVQLGEVWPGIEVAVHARRLNVEKIYTVAPGSDPAGIEVAFDGALDLAVVHGGALRVRTGYGPVTFSAPIAFQTIDGVRVDVPVRYRLSEQGYGFVVGRYDRTHPLVIDPVIQSSYFGTTSSAPGDEEARAIAIHPTNGDVYIVGTTNGGTLAGTAGGAQPVYGGASEDGYVARFDASLTTLRQVTYYGGASNDSVNALLVTATDVWIAGTSASSDLPGTAGGAQPADPNAGSAANGFIARLPISLQSITNATYFGGTTTHSTFVLDLVRHPNGDLYACGQTESGSLPATAGAYDSANAAGANVAFVARLPATLASVTRTSYFGQLSRLTCASIAASSSGQLYLAGETFNASLPNSAGGALPTLNGTFLGWVARFTEDLSNSPQSSYTAGLGEAVTVREHPANAGIYVTGTIDDSTPTIPPGAVANGAQTTCGSIGCQFVFRFEPSLTSVTAGTYLGPSTGSVQTRGSNHLIFDAASGDVLVTGQTGPGLPGASGGFVASVASNRVSVGFVSRLSADLRTLRQSSYVHDATNTGVLALALHPTNLDLYLAGTVQANGLPGATGGAQPTRLGGVDSYVMRVTADLLGAPATPGVLTFDVATVTAGEGSSSVNIGVSRLQGDAGAVSVTCSAASVGANTATAGSDYTAASVTLNWADGDDSPQTCSIPLLEDTLAEGPETFTIRLSGPTGGATLGSIATATATINDNDTAPPPPPPQRGTLAFGAATYGVGEAAGTATITVTRTGGSDGAVGVTFATSDGTATAGADYTALSSTVTFAAGDAATKTVTVTIANDTLVESAETINLTLSNVTGGATLGSPASAVLTITDDDVAPPPAPTPTPSPNANVEVRGSYGGGSLGGFGVALLGALALLRLAGRGRARLQSAQTGVRSAAGTLAPAASPVAPAAFLVLASTALLLVAGMTARPANAAETGPYVGARMAITESDLDGSDVTGALAAPGRNVVADVDTRDRGYAVYAGWRFTRFLALEAGAVDLGEFPVVLSGTAASANALVADAGRVLGDAGRGVSLVARADVPLGARFALVPRIGAYRWESEVRLDGPGGRTDFKRDGIDLTYGLALNFRISDRVAVGVAWDEYRAGSRNDIRAYGLQLEWSFARR
jgi:hypothetical protein